MEYKFASRRQLSFIISAGGRNLLVPFGARNQAGVCVFMTTNPIVAHAIRRHSLTRRGIIEDVTTDVEEVAVTQEQDEPASNGKAVAVAQQRTKLERRPSKTVDAASDDTDSAQVQGKERQYDNYTVARESICKEFGIPKDSVRNPVSLSQVAKEHGIIIKYKDI